jgi:hypothetical protein
MEFQPPDYRARKIEDWLLEFAKKFNPKFLLAIPIFTIPFMFYKTLMLIVLLIVATIFVSYLGSRTVLKKLGVELVTFTTVVTGVLFGMLPGIISGVVLIIIHDIITNRIHNYWVVVVPLFGVVGALAGLYPNINIILLGVGLTLFSHITFMVFQTVTRHFPVRYVPYFVLNVFLNAALFYSIAPLIVSVV